MSQSARLPNNTHAGAEDAYADLHERALKSMRLRAFQPQIAPDLEDSAAKRRAAIAALTRYHADWRDRIAEKEAKQAEDSKMSQSSGPTAGTVLTMKLSPSKARRRSSLLSQRDALSGSQENVHLQTLLHMAQLEHASHVERLAEQASFAVHAGGASTASVSAASALVPQTGRRAKTDADLESIAASILSSNTLVSMANRSDRISGSLFARAFDSSVSNGLLPASLSARGRLTAPRAKADNSAQNSPASSTSGRATSPSCSSTRAPAAASPVHFSGLDVAPSHQSAPIELKAAYYGDGSAFSDQHTSSRSRHRARSPTAGGASRLGRSAGSAAPAGSGNPIRTRRIAAAAAAAAGGAASAKSAASLSQGGTMSRLRSIPAVLPAYAGAKAAAAARRLAGAAAGGGHAPPPSPTSRAMSAILSSPLETSRTKAARATHSVSLQTRAGGAATIGLLSAALGEKQDAAGEAIEVEESDAQWRGESRGGSHLDADDSEAPRNEDLAPPKKGMALALEELLDVRHSQMRGVEVGPGVLDDDFDDEKGAPAGDKGGSSRHAAVNYADLLGPRDMATREASFEEESASELPLQGGAGGITTRSVTKDGRGGRAEVMLSADATSQGLMEDGSSSVPRVTDFNVKKFLRRMTAPDDAEVRRWTQVLLRHPTVRSAEDLGCLEKELTPLIAWLQMLTAELREDVFRNGTAVLLERGQTLFQQGDVGADYYLILQGALDVEVSASKTTDSRDLWRLSEAAVSEKAVPTLTLRRHTANSDLSGPGLRGGGSDSMGNTGGDPLSEQRGAGGASLYKAPQGVTVASKGLLANASLLRNLGVGFEGQGDSADNDGGPLDASTLRQRMQKGPKGGYKNAPGADRARNARASEPRVVINTLGPYDSFGEGALHNADGAGERRAGVICREKSVLLAIKASLYHSVMHRARITLVDRALDALRRTSVFMAWGLQELQRGLGLAAGDVSALEKAEATRRVERDARATKARVAIQGGAGPPSNSMQSADAASASGADTASVSSRGAAGGEGGGGSVSGGGLGSAMGAFMGEPADSSFLGKHAVETSSERFSRLTGRGRTPHGEGASETTADMENAHGSLQSDSKSESIPAGEQSSRQPADVASEPPPITPPEDSPPSSILPHGIQWWHVALGVTHLVYSPGEIIAPQGSAAHGFFVILLGHARVIRTLPVPAQLAHGLVGLTKLQGYHSYDAVLASPALQAMNGNPLLEELAEMQGGVRGGGRRARAQESGATLDGATLTGAAMSASSLHSAGSAAGSVAGGVKAQLQRALASAGVSKGRVNSPGGASGNESASSADNDSDALSGRRGQFPSTVPLPVELMQLRPGDSFGWADTLRTATEAELKHGPLFRAIWGRSKLNRALRKIRMFRQFGSLAHRVSRRNGSMATPRRPSASQGGGSSPQGGGKGGIADAAVSIAEAMRQARAVAVPKATDAGTNLGAVGAPAVSGVAASRPDGMFRGAQDSNQTNLQKARAAVAGFAPGIASMKSAGGSKDTAEGPSGGQSGSGEDATRQLHMQARYDFSLVAEERVEVLYFPREVAVELANVLPQRAASAYTAVASVAPRDEAILDTVTRWYNWDLYRLRTSFQLHAHPSVSIGPRLPRTAALVASARDLAQDVASAHSAEYQGMLFQGNTVSSRGMVLAAHNKARHRAAMGGAVPSSGLGRRGGDSDSEGGVVERTAGSELSTIDEGAGGGISLSLSSAAPKGSSLGSSRVHLAVDTVDEHTSTGGVQGGFAASGKSGSDGLGGISSSLSGKQRSRLGGIGLNNSRLGGSGHSIPNLRSGLKYNVAPVERVALDRASKGSLSMFARRQVERSAGATGVSGGSKGGQGGSKSTKGLTPVPPSRHSPSAGQVAAGQLSPRNRSSMGSYVDTASHAALYGESSLQSAHRIAGRSSKRHQRLLRAVATGSRATSPSKQVQRGSSPGWGVRGGSPEHGSRSSSPPSSMTQQTAAAHGTTSQTRPVQRAVRAVLGAGRRELPPISALDGRRPLPPPPARPPMRSGSEMGDASESDDESPEISRLYKLYELNNFNMGKYLVSDAPHLLPLPVPAYLPKELFAPSDEDDGTSSNASDTSMSSDASGGSEGGVQGGLGQKKKSFSDASSDSDSDPPPEELGHDPVEHIPFMHPRMVQGFFLVDPVTARGRGGGSGTVPSKQLLQRKLIKTSQGGDSAPAQPSSDEEDEESRFAPANASTAAGYVVSNVRRTVRKRRKAAERSTKRAEREVERRAKYLKEQAENARRLLGRAKRGQREVGGGAETNAPPSESHDPLELAKARTQQRIDRRAAKLRRRAHRRQRHLVKTARRAERTQDAAAGGGYGKGNGGAFRTVAEAIAESAAESMAELSAVGHISVGITADRVKQPRLFCPPPTAPAAALLIPALAGATVGAHRGQQNILQQLLSATELTTRDGRPVTPCTATALTLVDPDSALSSASHALGFTPARLRRAADRAYNPSGADMAALMVSVPSLKPIAPRSYYDWTRDSKGGAGGSLQRATATDVASSQVSLSDRKSKGKTSHIMSDAGRRRAMISARGGAPPPPPPRSHPAVITSEPSGHGSSQAGHEGANAEKHPPAGISTMGGGVVEAVQASSARMKASAATIKRTERAANDAAMAAMALGSRDELLMPGGLRRHQQRQQALAQSTSVQFTRRRGGVLRAPETPQRLGPAPPSTGPSGSRGKAARPHRKSDLGVGSVQRSVLRGDRAALGGEAADRVRVEIVHAILNKSPRQNSSTGGLRKYAYLKPPKLWTATSDASLRTVGATGITTIEPLSPGQKEAEGRVSSPGGGEGGFKPSLDWSQSTAASQPEIGSAAAAWSEYLLSRPQPYTSALLAAPPDARDIRYDAKVGAVVATVTRPKKRESVDTDVVVRVTMDHASRAAARRARRASIMAEYKHLSGSTLDVKSIVAGRAERAMAAAAAASGASPGEGGPTTDTGAAGGSRADRGGVKMEDITVILAPTGGMVVPASGGAASSFGGPSQAFPRTHTGPDSHEWRADDDGKAHTGRRCSNARDNRRGSLASVVADAASVADHGSPRRFSTSPGPLGSGDPSLGESLVDDDDVAKWSARARPLIPGLTAPPADFIKKFLHEVKTNPAAATEPRLQLLARHWGRALYWRMPPQAEDEFLPASLEEMTVMMNAEHEARLQAEHEDAMRGEPGVPRLDMSRLHGGVGGGGAHSPSHGAPPADLKSFRPMQHRPKSMVFDPTRGERGPPAELVASAAALPAARLARSGRGASPSRESRRHSAATSGETSTTARQSRGQAGRGGGAHSAATPPSSHLQSSWGEEGSVSTSGDARDKQHASHPGIHGAGSTGSAHDTSAENDPIRMRTPRGAIRRGAHATESADTSAPGRMVIPLPNQFVEFNQSTGRVMKTSAYAARRRLQHALTAEAKATATIKAVQTAAAAAAAAGARTARDLGGRGKGTRADAAGVVPESLLLPAAHETVWGALSGAGAGGRVSTGGSSPGSPAQVPDEAPGLGSHSGTPAHKASPEQVEERIEGVQGGYASDGGASVDSYASPPSDEEAENKQRARRLHSEQAASSRLQQLGPVASRLGQGDVGRIGAEVVGPPRQVGPGGAKVKRRVYLTPAAKRRETRAASTGHLGADAEIALGMAYVEAVTGEPANNSPASPSREGW